MLHSFYYDDVSLANLEIFEHWLFFRHEDIDFTLPKKRYYICSLAIIVYISPQAPWNDNCTVGLCPILSPSQNAERGAQQGTYGETQIIAPVLQFVIAGVECKGLHDIGPCSQEFPVQLSN